jgi:hypothetical protein
VKRPGGKRKTADRVTNGREINATALGERQSRREVASDVAGGMRGAAMPIRGKVRGVVVRLSIRGFEERVTWLDRHKK